jgi:hypothetical protein
MSSELESKKSKLKEIVDLAEGLPEKFQQKGFEILMHKMFEEGVIFTPSNPPEPEKGGKEGFIIPIEVKAFLRQYGRTEDELHKLFLLEKDVVKPIYTLKTIKKTQAQLQIAHLIALENALQSRSFEFSIEVVRSKCNELNAYDANNFSGNFKTGVKYFLSLDDKDHVQLSPDGKTYLSDVIEEITK